MYNFDRGLHRELSTRLWTAGQSVIEVGAGLGCYTIALQASGRLGRVIGYDGVRGVHSLTKGLVRWSDVTVPAAITAAAADWVFCMEVAEHIPSSKMDIFLTNVLDAACTGVVLSWSNECHGGIGHVNCKSAAEVVDILSARGFAIDQAQTSRVRGACDFRYLAKDLMVFRRQSGRCVTRG